MEAPFPFFDPHVHADSRSGEEFARLAAAGCEGLVAVSGPAGGFRSPDSLLDHFRRLAGVDRARIERAGLAAFVAVGVHPAGIPESGLADFLAAWPQALGDYGAAAVGEVGLQTGSEIELQVLGRAFEVAAAADLPLVLHTPRQDKARLLGISLDLLARSPLDPGRVLADHLDEQTLPQARTAGCWLGLSVHPAKLSPVEAAAIVAGQGPGRIVLDSDLGANPSWLFALPAAVSAMRDRDLSDKTIRAVVHDNALAWLGRDR